LITLIFQIVCLQLCSALGEEGKETPRPEQQHSRLEHDSHTVYAYAYQYRQQLNKGSAARFLSVQ
jgi:hypothetical protein